MADDRPVQSLQGSTASPGTSQNHVPRVGDPPPGTASAPKSAPTASPQPRRFHPSANLDPSPLSRDAGKIAEEVLPHITALVGTKAEVSLEIQAEIPDGAPEQVVRTVTENCRTLKFKSYGFEEK